MKHLHKHIESILQFTYGRSGSLLFVFVVVIPFLAIWLIWRESLKTEVFVTAGVALFTLFSTIYSQRQTLRENHRQQMRYDAYQKIIPALEEVCSALFYAGDKDDQDKKNKWFEKLRVTTDRLRRTETSYEMVFGRHSLLFDYIFLSLLELSNNLRKNNSDNEKEAHRIWYRIQELKRILMEDLGFSDISGVEIDKNRLLMLELRPLKDVATRENNREKKRRLEQEGLYE